MMLSLFLCAIVSVADGDTFRCQDGTRVRLAGIDAPEMAGHCKPGRACTPGNPQASKASLTRIAGRSTARCQGVGKSYNRVVAFCRVEGVDLSCAQVKARQAVRRYSWGPSVCRR